MLARHVAADVALVAVLLSVVTSRVFSPQYSIWLLGIGALCWVAASSRLRLPVAMVLAAAVIAQVLYPWGYGALLEGEWFAVLLQTARIVLVVAATVIAAHRILIAKPPEAAPAADQSANTVRTADASQLSSTRPKIRTR